jgi:hypothetical protein
MDITAWSREFRELQDETTWSLKRQTFSISKMAPWSEFILIQLYTDYHVQGTNITKCSDWDSLNKKLIVEKGFSGPCVLLKNPQPYVGITLLNPEPLRSLTVTEWQKQHQKLHIRTDKPTDETSNMHEDWEVLGKYRRGDTPRAVGQ